VSIHETEKRWTDKEERFAEYGHMSHNYSNLMRIKNTDQNQLSRVNNQCDYVP